MTLAGVLLDVDGTLVDSNDAHAHAWVRALKEAGFDVPFEEIRRLIGMGGDKLLPRACGLQDDYPSGKKISKRRGEIFQSEYVPNLRPFPHAADLLRHMRGRGLRLVAASSAKEDELKSLLRICEADGLIEAQTSSDDADHSKPAPDIVQAALAKLRLPPERAMMLGDTPYDVEAARHAGVPIVAVRCGGWQDSELAGAVAVYDDPHDILVHFDSSPLAW